MKPIELGQSCHLSLSIPFDGMVQLDLPSFASGGYLWRFNQAGDGLLVQVKNPSADKPEEEQALVVGGPSRQNMSFQPVRPGKVTLTLVNHRPWNSETLNTVTVDVDIQAL